MPATYKDIQKETGLSLSTISKYFNGGNMREKNRLAVTKAIEKLDFRVNTMARGLKSRRSHTIGVLIPELVSPFHTAIIADVEEYLREHGYGTIICDCHLDKDRERDALVFLLDKMVDGIITVPFNRGGEHLALAKQRNIPVVLIDRLVNAIQTDAVIVDNENVGNLAVAEMAAAGHKRLAIIAGPDGIYTMNRRMVGFIQALDDHKLTADPACLIHTEMNVEGGYKAITQLLTMAEPPTAVYCANDEITLGAILAINEAGIRIPEQLSFIGMDDIRLSRLVHPRLTMVMQPMQQIAQNAAHLMLERLKNPGPPASTTAILPLCLVRGGSVAAPPMP